MFLSGLVPSFALNQDRSLDGSPSVSITFPDGYTDTMVLSRYYSNENDRLARTENCHFFGHLEGEPDACIALTGCPGSDDLEFTIMSEHLSDTMFKWNKNGNVQVIKSKARSTFLERKDQEDQNGSWSPVDEDEIVNPAIQKAETEMAKNCASGNCKSVPTTMLLSLRFGYDEGFLNKTGSHAKAKAYVKTAMTHAQAIFCHSSLGTKIQLELVGEIKHYAGKYLQATEAKEKEMVEITKKDIGDADLMVYMGYDAKSEPYGGGGIAYMGTVCLPSTYAGEKSSINEWLLYYSEAGHLIAHEIGHNLGMFHDFDARHSGKGCDKKGVMSYEGLLNQWSTCSKSDFQAHMTYVNQMGQTWCMPRKFSRF